MFALARVVHDRSHQPNALLHHRNAARRTRLEPGSYSVSDLVAAGIGDDTLTSLWVPAGLEVQLFFEGDVSGTALTFSRNVPSLVSEGANDTIGSLIVTRR